MRKLSRKHLISDHAERVNIGASINFAVAHRLFGAHVRRRPHRDARDREPRVAFGRARNSEI